jgi:Bax protein
MSRLAPPKRSFERAVIAVAALSVVLLYGLVATDHFSRRPAPPQPALSSAPEAAPSRYARGFPRIFSNTVAVQYGAPASELKEIFDRIGYRLDRVRRHGEVPRIFFANLPEDLRQIRQPEERKVMFIKTALPLILHANELILRDRERIQALRAGAETGEDPTPAEQIWLAGKAEEYGLAAPDLARLERRVDIIPPSLALAQSAEESGWGTSRFAREGNAIFGQRTWRRDKGIVPERREDGETFRVEVFDRLIDGVRSYTRNLNRHPAYDAFRRARERLRMRGEGLDGYDLAAALQRYSERGAEYVETIRSIIRVNGLQAFDRARLGDRLALETGAPDT